MGLGRISFHDLNEIAVGIEGKGKIDFVPFEHAGKPVRIVSPHVVIGDVFDGKPFGAHFFGFPSVRSAVIAHEKNADVLIPFGLRFESEMQHPRGFEDRFGNVDSRFFPKFANGCLRDGFLGFDLSSRPIPFPFSKSSFFHGEKNFVLGVQDENKGRLPHGNS